MDYSFSNIASLTSAIVSAVIIIKLLFKLFQWCKSNPIKRYIERTAINKVSEEKLINIYHQLNEQDSQLLREYKINEDVKTNIIRKPVCDNDHHIKLKNLGLINELVNSKESTDKIKSMITNAIKHQQLQNEKQQLQELIDKKQSDGAKRKELLNNIIYQRNQQILQLNSQLSQLQHIQSQLQKQIIDTQPSQQQQYQQQLSQIAIQRTQFHQQIQQLTQQLKIIEQDSGDSNNDALKEQIEQLSYQLDEIVKNELTATLVIDVTITKLGNDILDIINKKVTESDIKSKLAFHAYWFNNRKTILNSQTT